MRKIYDEILKFLIERKKEHQDVLEQRPGSSAGLSPKRLRDRADLGRPDPDHEKGQGKPVSYMAPKEGALTWVDSMGIVKNAENLEQAYAFINWAYTPEAGAVMAKATGYNSVRQGRQRPAG
jgi:spermidine/putrescine transport system substrate-binding protein